MRLLRIYDPNDAGNMFVLEDIIISITSMEEIYLSNLNFLNIISM